MRGRKLMVALLALIVGGLSGNVAADDDIPKIQLVVPKIDYPATGVTGTRPFGINDRGNLSIQVNESATTFVGTRIKGHFSTPSQPSGTVGFASAQDINNLNIVVGNFFDGATFHGFLLRKGSYTVFDVNVPNVGFTVGIGINDFGVISGFYGTPLETSPDQAFRQSGSQETDLHVDSAVGSAATGTNDLVETAGYFSDSDPGLAETTCNCQGVVWDASGNPTIFTIPGAVSTIALGINVAGWVNGRFYDASLNVHGFIYNIRSGRFLTYDYPKATATSLNGINNLGFLAGRFIDSGGTAHGFIARIVDED